MRIEVAKDVNTSKSQQFLTLWLSEPTRQEFVLYKNSTKFSNCVKQTLLKVNSGQFFGGKPSTLMVGSTLS
jgi:hypothetical protein